MVCMCVCVPLIAGLILLTYSCAPPNTPLYVVCHSFLPRAPRQMYAEADEDGKAALSKAWEEGREKRESKRQPV